MSEISYKTKVSAKGKSSEKAKERYVEAEDECLVCV